MNYTGNDCRYEFTDSQIVRMRCALLDLRTPLTYSIGCIPVCDSTLADFTTDSTQYYVGTTVDFTNTSLNNPTSYSWLIDGVEVGTGTNLNHYFPDGGIYDVCLVVTGSDPVGCMSRKCMKITIYPVCDPPIDPCQKVKNGDFEQISDGTGSADLNYPGSSQVCNWLRASSTPFYCSWPDNSAIGLLQSISSQHRERIVSENPLNLVPNTQYEISFDYIIASSDSNDVPANPTILVGLTEDIEYTDLMPQSANLIVEFATQGTDAYNQFDPMGGNSCYPEGISFRNYIGSFVYTGDNKLYLNIGGKPGSYIHPVYNVPILVASGFLLTTFPSVPVVLNYALPSLITNIPIAKIVAASHLRGSTTVTAMIITGISAMNQRIPAGSSPMILSSGTHLWFA